MTPDPDRYVLIWREAPSRRIRTYTDGDGRPFATPMESIFPRPPEERVIVTAEQLDAWLDTSSSLTTPTYALRSDVAEEQLGWRCAYPPTE